MIYQLKVKEKMILSQKLIKTLRNLLLILLDVSIHDILSVSIIGDTVGEVLVKVRSILNDLAPDNSVDSLIVEQIN